MNTDSIKLLDADTLARADKLGMTARFIVEGYMAGEHKSPYRGFAIEFSQHKRILTRRRCQAPGLESSR